MIYPRFMRRQIVLPVTRWRTRMEELEQSYSGPVPEPLVPGSAPGRAVSPAWRKEMSERDALLRPLGFEMADAFILADESGRRQCVDLLTRHSRVQWQWPGLVHHAFDAYLNGAETTDLSRALALTAIYDLPAQGRDFHRFMIPMRIRMTENGIDAAAVFDEARDLAIRHDDPDEGAFGLFGTLGSAWDRPVERPLLRGSAAVDPFLAEWRQQVDVLDSDPGASTPDVIPFLLAMTEAYRHRLDSDGRTQARLLLAGRAAVTALWINHIHHILAGYDKRGLSTDLDLALTMIALSDDAARDDSIRFRLRESVAQAHFRGVTTRTAFEAAVALLGDDDAAEAARELFSGE